MKMNTPPACGNKRRRNDQRRCFLGDFSMGRRSIVFYIFSGKSGNLIANVIIFVEEGHKNRCRLLQKSEKCAILKIIEQAVR